MISLLERRWFRYPLFFLIGILTFFVALFFAFPDTEVKDIIEVQAEKALKHKYDVSIRDVDLYWLTGLELKDVKIQKVNEAEVLDENLPETIPMTFVVPKLAARLSVFKSLFNLAPVIQFRVDVGGGTISGTVLAKNQKITVDSDIGPIDLRKTPAIAAVLGVPFFGTLDGQLHSTIDQKLRIPIDGHFTLEGDKITFGPATVKTDKLPAMAFIEVPQTNMGNLKLDAGVEKSDGGLPEIVVKTFNFAGRDLRGNVWGRIIPTAAGRSMNLDLKMRTQFDTQFVTKNSLGPLLNISKVRAGKNKDWYGFTFTGNVRRIRFLGNPSVANGPAGENSDNDANSAENPKDETAAAQPPSGNQAAPDTQADDDSDNN